MILTEFTGIDTIVYYTPKIFKIAGYISNEQSILPAIIVGGSNVIFTIVSIFLVDRIGRRPLIFYRLIRSGNYSVFIRFMFPFSK